MGRADSLCRATLASVALLGALAPGSAPALGADGSASGKFTSRNWNVPIEDAYAFRARSGFDDKPAILVAVSNTEIGEDALDRIYYRRHMLDEWFADEETRIVYLEFAPDGSYRGYTYYFESGDGCGYCGGGVSSTVKLLVDYLTDNRPKTVAVRQGFTRGDEALLLVEGQSDVLGSMYGEVHLRREGGAWKIDDETLQMGKPAD